MLILYDVLDRLYLVSEPGRLFELELVRGPLHLLSKISDQFTIATFQKKPHLIDDFPVILHRDIA